MFLELDEQTLNCIKTLCDLSLKNQGFGAYGHVTHLVAKIEQAQNAEQARNAEKVDDKKD